MPVDLQQQFQFDKWQQLVREAEEKQELLREAVETKQLHLVKELQGQLAHAILQRESAEKELNVKVH